MITKRYYRTLRWEVIDTRKLLYVFGGPRIAEFYEAKFIKVYPSHKNDNIIFEW